MLVELSSVGAVEDLTGPLETGHDHVVYWAWIQPGVLRVRCFAPAFGVVEDEATGSAALRLAAALRTPLEIRQGRGSLLHARPLNAERGAVGGRVAEDKGLALPAF